MWYPQPGRIRRLKRTVPFTFRTLEGGLEGGTLRGAWLEGGFTFVKPSRAWSPLQGASRGLQGGLRRALRGLQGGLRRAWRGLEGEGFEGGLKGAWEGLQGGLRRASRRLQGGLRRASMGLQGEGGASRGLEGGFRRASGAWEGLWRWRGLQGSLVGASEGLQRASRGLQKGLKGVWARFERCLRKAWSGLRSFWEGCAAWSLAPQTDHLRLQYSLAPPSLLTCAPVLPSTMSWSKF